MNHSEYLRYQAERCVALSRATIDLTVAGRLRAMASELRKTAAEWDRGEHIEPACRSGARRGQGVE